MHDVDYSHHNQKRFEDVSCKKVQKAAIGLFFSLSVGKPIEEREPRTWPHLVRAVLQSSLLQSMVLSNKTSGVQPHWKTCVTLNFMLNILGMEQHQELWTNNRSVVNLNLWHK